MATTTKTAKTQKQVVIIARVQFKNNPLKVCYLVRSSDGKSQYETCLYDGRVTGCSCPATTGRCYHMTQVQQIEAERISRTAREAALEAARQASEARLAEIEAETAAYIEAELAQPAQPKSEQALLAARLDEQVALDQIDAELSVTAVELLALYAEQAAERNASEIERKAAIFAALQKRYDHRLQAQPIAARGTLNNSNRGFSFLR